jgi:hypothetical protein
MKQLFGQFRLNVKNPVHGFVPLPGTTIDPTLKEIDQATLDFFHKYLGRVR